MVKLIYTISFSLCVFSCFAQLSDIELIPDGITFPRMTIDIRNKLLPQVGQCIFNIDNQALECFDGTSWRTNKLEDGDGDTKILFQEFGNSSLDQIEFYINNNLSMKLEESPEGSTRLYLDDGQNNVLIGPLAGDSITSGLNNTFIGSAAGAITFDGQENVAIGESAGYRFKNGDANVTIGKSAGYNISNGNHNIIVGGREAGMNPESNDEIDYNKNIIIGSEAGRENPNAENLMIGARAGEENLGVYNTFIGIQAGEGIEKDGINNSVGEQNVAVGFRSGSSIIEGSINTFVGTDAGANVSTGDGNVAIGYAAGRGLNESNGSYNVMIGERAGEQSQGHNNVFIGKSSGSNVTGDHNIFLGSDDGDYSDVSNKLFIGNSAEGELITGEFDNQIVTIHGDLQIHPKGNIGTNSHLRMPDSNGNMDQIIRRSGTDNTLVIGDVNNNGGELHLNAAGETVFSVLTDGTVQFVPLSGPPHDCTTGSQTGQMYFDATEKIFKVCRGFDRWTKLSTK